MESRGKKHCTSLPTIAVYMAVAGLMTLSVINEADAAPPLPRDDAGPVRGVSVTSHSAPSPTPAGNRRLDLRLPDVEVPAGERSPTFVPAFSRRELAFAHEAAEAPDSTPDRGGNPYLKRDIDDRTVSNERTPTRAEAFAQHFRREGLPVARLWQNDSALLHLGLNQKGKPGLWLVQKIH